MKIVQSYFVFPSIFQIKSFVENTWLWFGFGIEIKNRFQVFNSKSVSLLVYFSKLYRKHFLHSNKTKMPPKRTTTTKRTTSAKPSSAETAAAEEKQKESALQARILAAKQAGSKHLHHESKPLRTFINAGSVTCVAVNQVVGDLLCAGTAHGDIAVIAPEVGDKVLAEEAGGNAEPVASSSILRNAHRKKVTAMTCDKSSGHFVTGSGDGSLKLWAVDPSASLFPVCVKTLFPQDFAAELEKPYVPPREKKFEVPEVCDVVCLENSAPMNFTDDDDDNGSSNGILFAAYSDGTLRKWDVDREECVQILKPSYGRVTCLSTLEIGNGESRETLLACGNDSGVVSVFSGKGLTDIKTPVSDEAVQLIWPEPIRSVAIVQCFVPPTSLKNPNPAPSVLCFAGSPSGTIYGFDVSTGEKKTALKHFGCSGTATGSAAILKLIQGPNCLFSAHDNGAVILWNILDWTVVATFWHSATEGRTSVLSSATMFPLLSQIEEDEEQQQQPADAGAAAVASPSASRRSGTAAASPQQEYQIPSSKVALVTSTMSGSISVFTECVISAVEALREREKGIADEVIGRLKAKREEEKANKRRF